MVQRRLSACKFLLFLLNSRLAGCKLLLFIGNCCFRTEKLLFFVGKCLFSVNEFLFFVGKRLLSVNELLPFVFQRLLAVEKLLLLVGDRCFRVCQPLRAVVQLCFCICQFLLRIRNLLFRIINLLLAFRFHSRIPPVARFILDRFDLRLYRLHRFVIRIAVTRLFLRAVRLDVNLCVEIRSECLRKQQCKTVDTSVSNRSRSAVQIHIIRKRCRPNNRKRIPGQRIRQRIIRSRSKRHLIPDLAARTAQKLRIHENLIRLLRHPTLDHTRFIHTVRQRNQFYDLFTFADVMQNLQRLTAVDRLHTIRLCNVRQIIIRQSQRSENL